MRLRDGMQVLLLSQAVSLSGLSPSAGCTHFIIGRDMAGCKSTLTGDDFYGPYDAQDTAKANAAELGMDTVPSLNITYTEAGLCHVGMLESHST